MNQLQPFLAAFHRLDPIYGQEIQRGEERERGWRQVHSSFKIYQGKNRYLTFWLGSCRKQQMKNAQNMNTDIGLENVTQERMILATSANTDNNGYLLFFFSGGGDGAIQMRAKK
jgi:hypothetical protein